ncbi:hypothetical protein LCGC14_2644480 [marine sediment metagenome]|uniref:Ribbon-helix-helix protein CopG domain-containing protein n=1 Tax=marine sediment metagenome TaxID=412755 RepID=A0A0F8ZWP0_9ZZZZ
MKGTTKLAVNLPSESVNRLRTYAEVHEITMTEALRMALGTQDFLTKEVCKGGKVLVEDKRGKFHQLLTV